METVNVSIKARVAIFFNPWTGYLPPRWTAGGEDLPDSTGKTTKVTDKMAVRQNITKNVNILN